jgi:hypothetical protein
MNKCAFVIPLHPKHFFYGYHIINELNNSDADLYFVFTNLNEKKKFQKDLSRDLRLNFLILEDFADLKLIEKNNTFALIKKLYALSVLFEKYDYISCIDSEIVFIKKNNFYKVMKNIVDAKKICGGILRNDMHNEVNILRDSLIKVTSKSSHNDLIAASRNFTLYTWWSNLPVFDCKQIPSFLNWINFKVDNLDNYVWNIFEDMAYNYFCVLYCGYELKIIPNIIHSLEFSNSKDIENVNENINKLYWVNKKAYSQNIFYYHNNDFYIVFHLDRTNFLYSDQTN